MSTAVIITDTRSSFATTRTVVGSTGSEIKSGLIKLLSARLMKLFKNKAERTIIANRFTGSIKPSSGDSILSAATAAAKLIPSIHTNHTNGFLQASMNASSHTVLLLAA